MAAFDFRTPPEAVHRAFKRLAGDLAVPGLWARFKLRTHVYGAFREAHRSGDSRREVRDVAAELEGHAWTWGFWNRAATDFRKRHLWPVYWSRDLGIPAGAEWGAVPPRARVELLVTTLAAGSYRERDDLQRQENDRTIKGAGTRRYSLIANDPDCPCEADAVATYGPAIAAGDYRRLPPYFPGDGTSVEWPSRRRRR